MNAIMISILFNRPIGFIKINVLLCIPKSSQQYADNKIDDNCRDIQYRRWMVVGW